MQSFLHSIGSALTPVLTTSKFEENGVLTPTEFVAAGDFLCFKCPTWSWSSAHSGANVEYLPAGKQFLVTRNVKCFQRAHFVAAVEDLVDVDDAGWSSLANAQNDAQNDEDSIPSIDEDNKGEEDEESVPDMEELMLEEPVDLATTATPTQNNTDTIMHTRTYDLYITYDKYYQTPRLWLCGYDEQHQPLGPVEVFEDVSEEHARKTATVERFPFFSTTSQSAQVMVSIHPCRHAEVMKRLIDRFNNAAVSAASSKIRVDQYLILFLKFMASVVPTIEYDYTTSI